MYVRSIQTMLAQDSIILDHDAAQDLARRVRAQHRRCWRNAALAVSHLGPGATYVEGWIVTAGTRPHIIEHGWCEIDGRVIDPTYVPYVTPDDPPVGYHGGLRFTVAQAEAAVQQRLPIAWSNETVEYWQAFEMAWRDATRRAPLEPKRQAKVVHCRHEAFDVFIGRPTQWASPYHIGPDGTREQTVAKFLKFVARSPGLLRAVWTLQGKDLGCRCTPLPCHGDVLARLANVNHIEVGRLLAPWMPLLTLDGPMQPVARSIRGGLMNLPARRRAPLAARR